MQRLSLAPLAQPLGALYVVLDVDGEILPPARPHARLGGQMVHDVDPGEDSLEVKVEEVLRKELEIPVAGERREVALLDPAGVEIGEGIAPDDVSAIPEQAAAEVGTDEPRRACHQHVHGRFSLTMMSFSLAMTRTGSSAAQMAAPTTRISAPASISVSALAGVIPPSTSMGMESFWPPIQLRSCRIFWSVESTTFCR